MFHPILDEAVGRPCCESRCAARYAYSKEGDWIYPRETNCRYLDVFEDIFSNKKPQADLAYLLALVIIKLRIVAAHDAAMQSLEDVDVESQREQANRLLDVIHLQNPSMIPALLNP